MALVYNLRLLFVFLLALALAYSFCNEPGLFSKQHYEQLKLRLNAARPSSS
jgi:hypothetical protein